MKKIIRLILNLGQPIERINVSIWAAAHLPLPKSNINPNLFLSVECCWVKEGVGVQLFAYWYKSIRTYR